MPTYDYRCDACGHEFEHYQPITANPMRKCPACGKSKLKRLIGTGAAVIFKGSGFWQTDYRSESYKKDAKADADAAKGATEKADAKADGKTEKKPAETAASDSSKKETPAKPTSEPKPKKSKPARPTKDKTR
jgi:putative FmdB family regulatory protein